MPSPANFFATWKHLPTSRTPTTYIRYYVLSHLTPSVPRGGLGVSNRHTYYHSSSGVRCEIFSKVGIPKSKAQQRIIDLNDDDDGRNIHPYHTPTLTLRPSQITTTTHVCDHPPHTMVPSRELIAIAIAVYHTFISLSSQRERLR
jgi:hypothetical protein